MSDDTGHGRLGGVPTHGNVGPADPAADPVTDPRLPVPADQPTAPVPTPGAATSDPMAGDGTGAPAPGKVKRSRTGVVWVGMIFAALVLLFLLVFILQNDAPVQIQFFALEGVLPSGVALLLAAIAGILLGAIPGSLRIFQLRRAARRGPGRADMLRLAGRPVPVVGRARVYVCGITPYDTTHLGHAATFVWGDLVARVLRHAGVDVEVCRNVTDVDDVLDAAAARAGARFDSFAAVQQFRFDRDMTALGVRRPTHEPRAHNHVAQVVALAAALLETGAAYERAGSVWFRGADVPARAGLDGPAAGALAEEFGERFDGLGTPGGRDDRFDVAVWRAAGPGAGTTEPAWPSPWGEGRPGWHAECAAMALTTFGPSLDLHVGGADLRFPHHAYEAAMAEAVTGVTPFARAWLHVGTVQVGGEKMAKSAGNLVLVSDVVAQHAPAALRLLLVDRPWAQPWDFEPAALDAAAARLERLYAAAARGTEGAPSADRAVTDALATDLDVPAALAVAEEEGGAAARLALSVLGLA